MRKLVRLSAATFVLCFGFGATQASAQVSPSVRDELRQIAVGGVYPTIMWTAEPDDSFWAVTIYSQPFGPRLAFEPDAERRWVARWNSGRDDTLSDDVRWADSRTCPGLRGVLWGLDQLQLPGPSIAGMTPDRPAEGAPPLHIRSPIFTVWGGARLENYVYRSGSDPLQEWGQAAADSLEDCWTDVPPTE